MAEQFSWVPYPAALRPGALPTVSSFVSMRVSSDNSFSSVRQEPPLGPSRGSPFCKSQDLTLHCCGPSSLPVLGTKIPQATGRGQRIKIKKNNGPPAMLSVLHFLIQSIAQCLAVYLIHFSLRSWLPDRQQHSCQMFGVSPISR